MQARQQTTLETYSISAWGSMSVPMFSHFKMEVVKFFSSAQRRKADEGVRIAHLDPETRMNSKDEFLQGTNLFLVPVRGVGM